MIFEEFKQHVEDGLEKGRVLLRTYMYERADYCYTAEIYTTSDPLTGIYILVDEVNVSVKIVQKQSFGLNEWIVFRQYIDAVDDIVFTLGNILSIEEDEYEKNRPPQAELILFKKGI